jgi:hypothetical protein
MCDGHCIRDDELAAAVEAAKRDVIGVSTDAETLAKARERVVREMHECWQAVEVIKGNLNEKGFIEPHAPCTPALDAYSALVAAIARRDALAIRADQLIAMADNADMQRVDQYNVPWPLRLIRYECRIAEREANEAEAAVEAAKREVMG